MPFLIASAVLPQWALPAAATRPKPASGRGRIEGIVRLVSPPWSAVQDGVYSARRVSRPAPKPDEIRNVGVQDVPPEPPLPGTAATILQTGEALVPRVVAITRGSSVAFPNADPFFHNVFSLSRRASFDLGRYRLGESRSAQFPAAGLVKVYCHIHSHMTANIMVFDHPFFRVPDADGHFAIENVPAGPHHVSAWHERIGESVAPVQIEAGRTTRIDFALPVDAR